MASIRSSIRRRRRERIRRLREHVRERRDELWPERPVPAPAAAATPREIRGEPASGIRGPRDGGSRPFQDPEEFWKERQKDWERLYRGQYREVREREAMWGSLWSWPLLKYKLAASLLLFALVWGLFALDHPRTEPAQRFIVQALTESVDFGAVEAWYSRHFDGFPAFIPAFGEKVFGGNEPARKAAAPQPAAFVRPAEGKIVTPFSEHHPGVLLETAAHAPVVSLDAGRVLYAGHTEETGWTVIVRHSGGITAYYGLLQDIQRSVNDWVKGGDLLGYASGGERTPYGQVYLAIKRDDRFIDPAEALNLPRELP